MAETGIDFVLTYVDGEDPVWLEKKSRFEQGASGGDGRAIRYRSWGNLKYWFRAVAKFCPWVRKVFLVTDHQAPDWIRRDCPQLELVDHEDFIPKEYLPVFSSHPIELNLHRIEGLSERFVYFNDDVFVLGPMREEDFFRKGLPCDYAIESPATAYDPKFAHVLANNALLLNSLFDRREFRKKVRRKLYSPADRRGMLINVGYRFLNYRRFFGFENAHVSVSYLKSSFGAMWELAGDTLDQTCRSRFRSDGDVNQYVIQQYQYVNGLFTPSGLARKCRMFRLSDGAKENVGEAAEAIASQRYRMICLNEAEVTDFDAVRARINGALEKLLPERSGFEM